jgi:hypothetical protein
MIKYINFYIKLYYKKLKKCVLTTIGIIRHLIMSVKMFYYSTKYLFKKNHLPGDMDFQFATIYLKRISRYFR